ncbi:MAG TPA: GntR family transcriptional regulator [Caulobacteraceae bacterium]|nr:GntR family transcriptional regulator [Caulobacteraceae bacterium]
MTNLQPASAAPDQSKAERVYHELRRRIRELDLPPGAPLRKEEIALAMGVSRAPVSEAIARLADEALVDVFPQHGSFVAPIRAEDVRESLFIRAGLETEAARRVTQLGDAAAVASLEENMAAQVVALDAGDLGAFYDLDEAFHALIFAAIASPRALRLLDAVRAPLDRPRRLMLPESGRPEATLAEHRRILDAIASGDAEFAASAMRVHLTMVARVVERALQEIEARRG